MFVVENNYPCETGKGREDISSMVSPGWYLIADSAVTNTGKPFYLPEKLGLVTVALGAAIRITRLGKSIAPKFAGRYFKEIAPVLHFSLPEYREKLKMAGLPLDASENFDRSLFVGEFQPIEGMREINLRVNEKKVSCWKIEDLYFDLNDLIADLSTMNTIKMGDLIVPGLCSSHEMNEGDKLEVEVGGVTSFQVKVK